MAMPKRNSARPERKGMECRQLSGRGSKGRGAKVPKRQ